MTSIKEISLPDLNGGLNVNDPEYSVADNQSPDMLNMWFKGRALVKRDGQTLVVCGLDGAVHGISPLYNGYYAVHAGRCLYKWHGETAQLIKSGLPDSAGVFCEFGDALYYLDGTEIWELASDYGVSSVTPYIPCVMFNARPDLSESDNGDAYNLLGAGFTVKYNADGESTAYSLPQTGLDAATVNVSVNATDLTEGVHFTVNRTAGTVSSAGGTSPFGAPPKGSNNVWITASKTMAGNKRRITGCRVAVPFGGEAAGVFGGTRVFVMGNPDYPRSYWHSDLGHHVGGGMRYFPDTGEEFLDQNSEPITAAAKMGGELMIFKESSIFKVGYSFDGEDVFYPVRECHSAIGCDMPGSVQLIDNRLVFAHSKTGVHMLVSTDNETENAVKPLSANIGALLLSEDGLQNACSVDSGRYYWLCAGGHAYLWDYEQTPYYDYADYEQAQRRLAWYRFDNVHAHAFCDDADGLCYGSHNGIVRFTRNQNDFDEGFLSYYTSKAFDLGSPNELKTFLSVYPSFALDGNVKATMTVGSDKKDVFKSRAYDIKSFAWDRFGWAAFSWDVIRFVRTYAMRLNMRNSVFIQLRISGSEKDRGVGFAGLRFTYCSNKKMR